MQGIDYKELGHRLKEIILFSPAVDERAQEQFHLTIRETVGTAKDFVNLLQQAFEEAQEMGDVVAQQQLQEALRRAEAIKEAFTQAFAVSEDHENYEEADYLLDSIEEHIKWLDGRGFEQLLRKIIVETLKWGDDARELWNLASSLVEDWKYLKERSSFLSYQKSRDELPLIFQEEADRIIRTNYPSAGSLEELNRRLKDEANRKVLDGQGSKAFVVAVPSLPGGEKTVEEKVFKITRKWLIDRGALSSIIEGLKLPPVGYSPADFVDEITKEVMKSFREGRVTAGDIRNAILLALRAEIARIWNVEVSPDNIITFAKGLSELTRTLSKVLEDYLRNEITFIIYLTTRLDDFLLLGTRVDQNPNSCFWRPVGAHSIPGVILAQNLLLGFVFEVTSPQAGFTKGQEFHTDFFSLYEHPHTKRVGRFLLHIDEDGEWDVSNLYVASEEIRPLIVRALNTLIDTKLQGIKLEKPTEYFYLSPSV